MNLIINIYIILTGLICVFGEPIEPIYKATLRGLYKKQQDELIHRDFLHYYQEIIAGAKQGAKKYEFTPMCYDVIQKKCKNGLEGHKLWIQENGSLYHQGITQDIYETEILNKLRETFIDSNINKEFNNCCNKYTIEW